MAVRIELWPTWLKVVAVCVAVLVVGTAVVVPATGLRFLKRPTSATARASASPSAGALPAVSASPGWLVADLACKLPISSYQAGSGGFVTFPAGTFSSDPGSNVPGRSGGYYGGGFTYDRAVGTWLPVSRSAVTPDGSRFVYWDNFNRNFRLVTVSTGAEVGLGPRWDGPAWGAASIARMMGSTWTLLEAVGDGVYGTPPYGQVPAPGLWFFPYTGAERQVTTVGYWHAIGGGAAWGSVAPSAPEGATVAVVRLDLGTGASASWFSRDGMAARVQGFDESGSPVVVTTSRTAIEVWLVDRQDHGNQLLSLPRQRSVTDAQGGDPSFVQSVLGDANGVWIATGSGLYLSRNGTTQKVSSVTGALAGGCA